MLISIDNMGYTTENVFLSMLKYLVEREAECEKEFDFMEDIVFDDLRDIR